MFVAVASRRGSRVAAAVERVLRLLVPAAAVVSVWGYGAGRRTRPRGPPSLVCLRTASLLRQGLSHRGGDPCGGSGSGLSVGVPVLALVLAAAGGVVAATQSSDEQALQPTDSRRTGAIESRVSDLLAKMTLEEKLEQIQLLPDFMVTDDEVRKGLGSVLSVTDPQRIRELQRIAVEESRLKIPILFAFDTIHGFRTIFPIPLGAGASFDPQVAFDDHKYGARESAAVGLKQTYAPMVDVSHEPRWGRISEAGGRGPLPELGARGRAREGDPGRRLQRAATSSWPAPSTSWPTASPRAAVTTTRPTCPSSGCGTSTCRRSRPRSTPAPTRSCARSTPSTACRAAATTTR